MGKPFEATANVCLKGGLVCIEIHAPGAPETVLRLPRDLAMSLARRILATASTAPNSFVTGGSDG